MGVGPGSGVFSSPVELGISGMLVILFNAQALLVGALVGGCNVCMSLLAGVRDKLLCPVLLLYLTDSNDNNKKEQVNNIFQ